MNKMVLIGFTSFFFLLISAGPSLAERSSADTCSGYTYFILNPFGAGKCVAKKCPSNDKGTPKCYPFPQILAKDDSANPFIGTCVCAGKNPIGSKKSDAESDTEILGNYLEVVDEVFGSAF